MTGGGEFSNADHLLALREESCERQKNRDDANDAKLKGLVGDLIGTNWILILRAQKPRCLDECTRHYGNCYSIVGYGIS